jgi:hypothetical protein
MFKGHYTGFPQTVPAVPVPSFVPSIVAPSRVLPGYLLMRVSDKKQKQKYGPDAQRHDAYGALPGALCALIGWGLHGCWRAF